MLNCLWMLLADEAGFIVSSELVLVSTIGVLGMTVGLAEVSNNVNGELIDVARGVRQMNQTYSVTNSAGTTSSYSDLGM